MIGWKPLGLVLALCLPVAAMAQSEEAVFDIAVAGVRAGSLSLAADRSGASYAVRTALESGGVVRLLRRVRFDAAARGTEARGRYTPDSYTESADTGQRQSEVEMTYAGGVPQILAYTPAPAGGTPLVDPAQQGGTLDPATALYAVLRDLPADQACTLTARTFDGRRLAQVTLSGATPQDAGLLCQGQYRRIDGFTAKEMADRQQFAFSLIYAATGHGLLRVREVQLDTIFGKATLTRR